MLDLNKHDQPRPKCLYAVTTLPSSVNQEQLSKKRKPFSIVSDHAYSHTLDVVAPKSVATRLQQSLTNGTSTLRYARVHMKLSDVIEGDFLNQHIKSGNVLMLSEGRPGVDQIYSLIEGLLRLEMDKATYERVGLEGKAIPSGGRKHVKARYAIEINLRLPSMVHGKKGFERVLWAFRNVLHDSVTWLFHDLKSPTDGSGPIAIHAPLLRTVEPEIHYTDAVVIPDFPEALGQDDYEEATDVLEWLSLVLNASPRVIQGDAMDPYLSRYRVPDSRAGLTDDGARHVQNLVRFHWHGFLPSAFVTTVLLATFKASNDDWSAVSASSFNGETYTIVKNQNTVFSWEYAD